MADTTVQMKVANTQEGGDRGFAFEYSESLAAAGETKLVLIPDGIQNVSISAEGADGASVVVYSSVDTIDTIKLGTGITWIAWSAGSITSAVGAVFNPVTAIKMIQTGTGSSKLSMRAQ